jgi:predicted amino acid racemase
MIRINSPGTPASSTTKTGRHDIAETLLKVALNTKNQSINQSILLLRSPTMAKQLVNLITCGWESSAPFL